MWTLDKLREVAADRGETPEADKALGAVLLAHERFRGRTEEHYGRERAQKELDQLLGAVTGPLPPQAKLEYGGLVQLRTEAGKREPQRVRTDAGKAPPVLETATVKRGQPSPLVEAASRGYDRADGDDADRG